MAFLSGCFPIALINFIRNIVFPLENSNVYVEWFSVTFFAITVVSAIVYFLLLRKFFRSANILCIISDIKRVDMFSSGAISYYILPFISFIGNDVQNAITLFIVIILLLIIFNNNMMFMYTPILDCLGYKVLECRICNPDGSGSQKAKVVVKTDNGLYFSGNNLGKAEKVNEDTFFFILVDGE